MFPTGWAGVALVILRSVVAITVLVDINRFWNLSFVPMVEGIVALMSVCLLLGLLTPYCATISCFLELALIGMTQLSGGFHLSMSALTGAAAAILGPGAYSLDARIFGRRVITIPPGRTHRSATGP